MAKSPNSPPSPPIIEAPPELIINGMPFSPVSGVRYQHDYLAALRMIEQRGKFEQEWEEGNVFRTLLCNDLWFMVYFGLQVPIANNKWWVDCCRDVEEGPETETIDLWARDHGKSTIITTAETIQHILKYPELTNCILSYTKDTAKSFFGPIKLHLEGNIFLRNLFPDVLYAQMKDSPQWNDQGITVRRSNRVKECTLEAWGLTDGMPTGRHFDRLIYDDIVTYDMAGSTSIMDRVKNNFDMSMNIGKDGTKSRVIGTPYHHEDVLSYLQGATKMDGTKVYHVRKKPATVDGSYNGDPVWLSSERLELLKRNKRVFATQYLLDPTPMEDEVLSWHSVKNVGVSSLPERMIKLMAVDPSGGSRTDGRRADAWGILVVGVDPYIGESGSCRVFILDGYIGEMRFAEGIEKIVEIYLRNGVIRKLGVEKVGMSSTELHVSNAFKAKGRIVSIENGMLVPLRSGTGGGGKHGRIEGYLGHPLRHGLVHIADSCPASVKERLREEMEKYPLWGKDDGIDALAYIYQMLKEYRLPLLGSDHVEKRPESVWDKFRRSRQENNDKYSWMKN